MKIKSIKNYKNISDKIIFLRADLNVPILNGKIKDDYKIKSSLVTIKYLLKNNCKIIIASHLGNPEKDKKSNIKKYSLLPVAKEFEKILKRKNVFCENYLEIGKLLMGNQIIFLENLRFHKEEKENNIKFAKQLASLADIYVNDAFAVSHRRHATIDAIKYFLPSYAGFLLEEEVSHLSKIIHPQNPLITVLGGVKINTKIKLINNLYKKTDKFLIGGALANVFLKAHNFEIGKSLFDIEGVKIAKILIKKDKLYNKILLPVDAVVAIGKNTVSLDKNIKVKHISEINKNDYILDIGPETIKLFSRFIKTAKTIIWNGPLGFFEQKNFSKGTLAIAQVIAMRSSGRAFGVSGGGETDEALTQSHMAKYMDWVSTGGGAMLAYLGNEKMPGLEGIVK